jgi:hypothetical protein
MVPLEQDIEATQSGGISVLAEGADLVAAITTPTIAHRAEPCPRFVMGSHFSQVVSVVRLSPSLA